MDAVIDHPSAKWQARRVEAGLQAASLQPITSDAGHAATVTSLNTLLDAGAGQHDHVLADLAGEAGSQGVVSEILHGKRASSLRQMRALAQRFGVPAAAFIESSQDAAA